ncbi:indolepyruvate ferredoxin oxidoreductase subunit alpha [Desulfuromonas thiophila]|uniref:Indolepyruvate oxidoreductase subunit IorA n=1 Tax=Desulfuromonas thiophila TaxID=57664 RepID=A0A1G7AHB8_9BACT|nr:indolepyruvate ferredoxin oxidoreductase subunit alpha [Desulfuromonas thiophila]SDE14162.1 indolepyruvate ferredoxin oxidoreductase alpha subunit [Desulfuromonas thiophila]
MNRKMLSGNEAIARGAFEAGVRLAVAYPGTPSTEILENCTQYPSIDASWAPNEKVSLEVAIGACFGGARSLVAMKHVGVNVAADPLFTLSYTGVVGGLVLAVADDPEMHSSQNEQDSRHYARAAKVPLFEPADSQEALEFTRLAFAASEQFDTPILLRTTTRIAHSKSIVTLGEPLTGLPQPALRKDPPKFVMLPGNARKRHLVVEERLQRMADWACSQPFNRIEERSDEVGVITAGVAYQYAREVLPEASVLKLGQVYPLPLALVRDFATRFKTLYVIEELEPFIEEQVRALGFDVIGKDRLSLCGELTPGRLRQGLLNQPIATAFSAGEDLPQRPPNLCPGCPHRGVFYALNRLKAFVTGDIGCYTLGFMPPLSAMDTCVCMGASVGNAAGLNRVLPAEDKQKVVGVIGDSTFLHTGINGLMDMVYNGSTATLVILDNRITAMTGRQENPASGYTLAGVSSKEVDLEQLCRSVGVEHVRLVDPWDLQGTETVIREEMARPAPSVVIARGPCVLIKRDVGQRKPPLLIDEGRCTGCKACLKIGCPAISWQADKGERGQAVVDTLLCVGCGICAQLCRFDAFSLAGEGGTN